MSSFSVLSEDAKPGVHVTWSPSSAAHLVKAIYARDGKVVAVILRPSGPHAVFRLIATRDGKTVASAAVKLREPG